MESLTMKKKIKVLEHAFAASAGAYYSINLSKNIVPGTMYQVIDDEEYSINEQIGMPEDAAFSDVVNYWGSKLDETERSAYFEFFEISNLMKCYEAGKPHVWHRYWTKTALFEPMLAEQHIVMYEDEENGDILAISYVLDLTQTYKEEQYKKELEEKQKALTEALRESEKARKYEQLKNTLKVVDEVLENLSLLDNITSEKELNEILPRLLESLGRYAKADRAYLFSWASQEDRILRMTHEWCDENVRPTIREMQHVEMADMPNWSPRLENKEAIISLDWEKEKVNSPEEYALFDGQDIHALIVIPVFANNKLNGYIGFDNPEPDKTDLSVRMLTSAGGHIGSLKENLRMMTDLEHTLAEATMNSEIVNTISKMYWLIYRIDLSTGIYEEVSAGEEMHHLTGKRGLFKDVFGNAREMIVASGYQEIMEKFLDTDTLAERMEDTESIAQEYQAANGAWHRGRFIVKKRDANGKATNVLYVVNEIDREKKKELEYKKDLLETTEKAKKANQAKSEFLRRMSHDIRTPINGIVGLLNINKAHFNDKELVRQNQEKMELSAVHLLSLINDVLQMSKIEDGSVTLTHEYINLFELSDEIDVIIQERAAENGIQVEVRKDHPFAYPYVYGSPLHLRQIFINICDNCIKYNRPGGKLSIAVEAVEKTEKTCTYRWTISDTGIGMNEEFLRHIFEPFAQEKEDARSTYNGVGLGMSIVKGLIDSMGGTISVKSKEGCGSVFEIELPFELAKAQEVAIEELDDAEATIQGIHLMLVEDNELNAEIAEMMLADLEAYVTVVNNGLQAIELFEKNPAGTFDAILMDIMMPVMDGITATKKLRALDRADAQTIPVIAMTANAFQEDEEICLAAGMNAHLTKPLNIEQLKRTIHMYVKR